MKNKNCKTDILNQKIIFSNPLKMFHFNIFWNKQIACCEPDLTHWCLQGNTCMVTDTAMTSLACCNELWDLTHFSLLHAD